MVICMKCGRVRNREWGIWTEHDLLYPDEANQFSEKEIKCKFIVYVKCPQCQTLGVTDGLERGGSLQ